jgi:hypothetical protein
MRIAIVVMLLVGCVVGQSGKIDINPKGKDLSCQRWLSDPACNHPIAKPGDCYRVKQDGTLEKVLYCGNGKPIVLKISDSSKPRPGQCPSLDKDNNLVWGKCAVQP